MKRTIISLVLLIAAVTVTFAQQIEYEKFIHEQNFFYFEDGERQYLSNSVDISLPVSASEVLPLETIKSTILSTSFDLLDDHVTNSLTSIDAVKSFMSTYNLSPELPDENLRSCASIPSDQLSESINVTVQPQCINDGILTMRRETNIDHGGVHGIFLVSFFYIDIKSGQLVSDATLLTDKQKTTALRLLSTPAGARKYADTTDLIYEPSELNEISRGIRGLGGNLMMFPPFYVNDGKVFMIFPQYSVCSYHLGMPPFAIPLSALNANTNTPVKRGTVKTSVRRNVRR